VRFLIWLVFVTVAQSAWAQDAQKRVALVIGNSDYQKPGISDLPNARRDAEAIGNLLSRIGFSVTTKYNLGYDAMRLALRDFAAAAEGADAALIHFAGHGLELSLGGGNFVAPVDAELKSPQSARQELFSLSAFEDSVAAAHGLKLIILDACRNNPYPQTITRGGAERGLARPEPRERILVAFSARHGTVAQDGAAGSLSPFATALIEHLPAPGEEIRFIMGRVEDAVIKATGGAQQPFTYGSLGGEKVYLIPPQTNEKPVATAPKPQSDVSAAERAWQAVNPESKDQLLAIQRRFPDTFYADVAKSRIEEIERREAAARLEALKPKVEPSENPPIALNLPRPNAPAQKQYHYVWDTRPPDDYLSLRSEPTVRGGFRITKMPNGTLLDVLEKQPDGWWRVKAVESGEEGWTKFRDDRDRSRVWIYCCRSR